MELTLIERLATAFFHFFLIGCFFYALWLEAGIEEAEWKERPKDNSRKFDPRTPQKRKVI